MDPPPKSHTHYDWNRIEGPIVTLAHVTVCHALVYVESDKFTKHVLMCHGYFSQNDGMTQWRCAARLSMDRCLILNT
jgi:hypothetical protein